MAKAKSIEQGWYFYVREDEIDEDSCIVGAEHPWLDIVYIWKGGNFCDRLTDGYDNVNNWGPDAIGKTFFKVEVPEAIRAQYPDLENHIFQ